ncbi:MAG: cytochrome c biogenesis protein [Gemmatimonadales bacterium]
MSATPEPDGRRPPAMTRDAALAQLARPYGLLFGVAVAAVIATLIRVAFFTPIEASQGPAQKIFYIHVPAAVTALYLAFALMAVASVLYLWLRDPKLDRVASTSAEVGLAFTTVVLVTGPLWAKPVWGTWWSGDARLTSTLFLWLIILGYLILRQAVDDRAQRARYSAVLAILAGLLIPFIHLSVYLFRTLHPQPIVLKPSAPSLPPEMLTTLLMSFASFALLFVALLRARYRLATIADAGLADGGASGRSV